MMQIKYSDVPQWLQDSNFYRNLSEDEPDNSFELPTECYRETVDSVRTIEDVTAVLKVMRFWGVACIPHSVLEFCYLNEIAIWDPVVAEVLGKGLPEHSALKLAFKDQHEFTLEKALQTDRSEFISFWLHQLDADRVNNDHAIVHASRFGRTELVETLRERGLPWDACACCAAAQYGHLVCLQYLHEKGCPFDEKALIYAARGGQLECMKYLHTHGCLWQEDVTLEYAVPQSHELTLVSLFVRVYYELLWSDDWSIVPPAGGYLECLRYALENGCPVHSKASIVVAEYGLLDCLQLLHLYGAEWNAKTTYAAAYSGRLDCLTYAHENGCPWNEHTTRAAVGTGHMDCLRYLHDHGCPWSPITTKAAAGAGRLGCLEYLHQNGCPWDNKTVEAAAYFGHLDCLTYAHENGCPWDEHATRAAAEAGRMDCLRYLHNNGCPCSPITTKAAAGAGRLCCLEYLRQNGCPWDNKTVKAAARGGHLDCLRFAFENGCVYNGSRALRAALRAEATHDCLRCLRYLVEECNLYQDLEASLFSLPFREGKIDVVQYLTDVGCPIKDYVFVKPGWCLTRDDAGLVQCIQYAIERGWQYNNDLLAYIEENDLPLCQAYVVDKRWTGKLKVEALLANSMHA